MSFRGRGKDFSRKRYGIVLGRKLLRTTQTKQSLRPGCIDHGTVIFIFVELMETRDLYSIQPYCVTTLYTDIPS